MNAFVSLYLPIVFLVLSIALLVILIVLLFGVSWNHWEVLKGGGQLAYSPVDGPKKEREREVSNRAIATGVVLNHCEAFVQSFALGQVSIPLEACPI